MKTTMQIRVGISVFLCLVLLSTASTAWAGHRGRHHHRHSRHLMHGVAIGVGAAILGAALLTHATQRTTVHYQSHAPRGHYEYRQVWVPAQYEQVWVGGHYNRYGAWVMGHYGQRMVRPGYYTQQRVYVN